MTFTSLVSFNEARIKKMKSFSIDMLINAYGVFHISYFRSTSSKLTQLKQKLDYNLDHNNEAAIIGGIIEGVDLESGLKTESLSRN